jgi:putative transposase
MNKHLPASDLVPAKWAFRHSDRYFIRDVEMLFQFTDGAGHRFVLREQPDIAVDVSDLELSEIMTRKELRTIPHGHLRAPDWRRESVDAPSLVDLRPAALRNVMRKKTYCDTVLRLESEGKVSRSDAMLNSLKARLALEWNAVDLAGQKDWGHAGGPMKAPSAATIGRWLRIYEAASFEAMALADGRGKSGNQTPRLHPMVQKLVAKYALRYCKRTRPSITKVYGELRAKIAEWNRLVKLHNARLPKSQHRPQLLTPARPTLARAIRSLGEFKILAGRFGEEHARRKLAITVGEGVDVTRPLERAETDCWKIPLQAIMQRHPVWSLLDEEQKAQITKRRLWLDTVFCTTTRVVLAARLVRTPTAAGKVQTLAMSLVDKSHYAAWASCENAWGYCGTWETLAGDTGSEVLNYQVQNAVIDLTATTLLMPAGVAAAKGRQERLYRTVSNGLIAGLSGYSFQDVVQKGDYDSEGNAVFNVEELGRLIVRWIVDVYHRTPHAGLGGATPHDTWCELRRKFRVLPPPDADRMRHILGINLERQIGGQGIRVLGLIYQSEALQKVRFAVGTKPVAVRLDSEDIGAISVLGPDGWITVPCKRRKFDKVPLFQWLHTAAEIRKRNAHDAGLHEESVLRALRDLEYFSNAAMSRAGIAAPILTHKTFAKLETSIFKAFRFADEGPGLDDVLHSADDVGARYTMEDATAQPPALLESLGPSEAPISEPIPAPLRNDPKFLMED